jgi:hypothetical protein
MTVPQGFNANFTLWQGFDASAPTSVQGSPISAQGYLKQNTELGRFGLYPNGLYWTTVIDVPLGTNAQDAWDSFLNNPTPANSDTVLVQDYPIPGWCTPFLVVLIERLSRGQPSDRLRLYLDRCQPVQGACPTSGGGVTTPCCANSFPTTLHVTVTDSGSCGCIDGTYALTWDPSYTGGGIVPNGAWVSPDLNLCGSTFNIVVYCNAGLDWKLALLNASFQGCITTATSVSCSPISLTYPLTMSGTCAFFLGISNCSGPLTFVVTQ